MTNESPRPSSPRISFPALLIASAVLVVLGVLVIPSTTGCMVRSKLAAALSHGREIHQATYRMVLDNAANPNPELGWPGDLATAEIHPVTTTGQFVERLVAHKYLDRGKLGKLFGGPARRPPNAGPFSFTNLFTRPEVISYPGTGPFEGRHSVFTFFKVTEKDPDRVIFLATKNFHFGAALDPMKPYGDAGCVIVRKAGDAQSLSASQARDKKVGLMPGGTIENRGDQEGNVLKD
jgi:hypothetical protein